MNDVATAVFSIMISAFCGVWLVFGIGWIKRASKKLSGTPVRVNTLE